MQHRDITIGMTFRCGDRDWRVTDVGTRVVIAIPVTIDWMNGPPFALPETVFDENDLPVCEVIP